MDVRGPLLFSIVGVTLGCADARPPVAAETSACASAITTGIVGRSMQASDTDRSRTPNRDVSIVVFRADDPALAQPIPSDLAPVAEHLRGDLDVGAKGHPHRRRIAVPPERLGTPVAATTTDASGCFALELPAGSYALGKAQSMMWIEVTVAADGPTRCDEQTGYRFATWTCDR